MKKCPRCGLSVTDPTIICPDCGLDLINGDVEKDFDIRAKNPSVKRTVVYWTFVSILWLATLIFSFISEAGFLAFVSVIAIVFILLHIRKHKEVRQAFNIVISSIKKSINNMQKLKLSILQISVIYVVLISAVVGSCTLGFSTQYEDTEIQSEFIKRELEFSELKEAERQQNKYNEEERAASLEVWNLKNRLNDINAFEASQSEHNDELNALSEQLKSLEAAEQAKTNELNQIQANIDKQ